MEWNWRFFFFFVKLLLHHIFLFWHWKHIHERKKNNRWTHRTIWGVKWIERETDRERGRVRNLFAGLLFIANFWPKNENIKMCCALVRCGSETSSFICSFRFLFDNFLFNDISNGFPNVNNENFVSIMSNKNDCGRVLYHPIDQMQQQQKCRKTNKISI